MIAILNICKFIRFVGACPADTNSAFNPLLAIPNENTIGNIIEVPLTPNSHNKLEKVIRNMNPHKLSTTDKAGVKILIIASGKFLSKLETNIIFNP